jgi:tetratricopeptide (TPR) repeat protein
MKGHLTTLLILIIVLSGCQKRDARGYYERGVSKAEKENYKGALADLNMAIELDKSLIEAYFARAFYVKEITGDYQGAIEDYTTAIDLKSDDNDFNLYSNRGHAKFMLKDYKGAITDIQMALSLNPKDPFTYRNRVLLFIQIKNMPMACQDMKKALELGFTDLYGDEIQKLFEHYCNDDGTEK